MNARSTLVTIISVILLVAVAACGGPKRLPMFDTLAEFDEMPEDPAPWDFIEEDDYKNGNPIPSAEKDYYAEDYETPADSSASADKPLPQFPANDSVAPLSAKRLGRYNRIGSLREVFNDSNKYQYAFAERIGIKPIYSLSDAYYLSKPLLKISTCRWYDVDTLKHSMPYLVPEAARLLETIGLNFADSLKSRNAPGHKFRVTSLLRTSHSVKRLRRVNRNATDSSTHKFGTTFDISYARFNYYGAGTQLSDEELKYILAEVLRDLRAQQKCMVKFERHTPCFHITATGR